jgi:hypothetical protein
MRRSLGPYACASVAYALLTAVITWPLILHPRTLVPSDLGDPLLNVWIAWWNAAAVPLTDAWWNAPQFYPFKGAIVLSEHLLGLTPITTPIILATGDPLLGYNVAFLLAFFLCALTTHFLVVTISGRHDVAFVAGIAFAFAPYRFSQIAHIQVLSTYWMPLSLAGLHKYVDQRSQVPAQRGKMRWVLLFAFAWMMQALACGYYLFFLSVLVVLWLAWFALFRGQRRQLVNVLLAWALAAALVAPLMYGYWQFSRAYNLRRSLTEIRQFSADIASVLKAWDWNLVWGWLDVLRRPESDLFPGVTVVVVATISLAIAWLRASKAASGYPRAARVLVVFGALALAVSIARAAQGPFRVEIAGLRLLSVTSPEKPISVAVLCLTVAALLHPAIRAAWRDRSSFAFYALATFAMWLMALGPAPTLMNVPAIYKAPYAWLLLLPGADGVRVPARFWMLAAFCLAVTAALGIRRLQDRWPRFSRGLIVLSVAGILIDGWPRVLTMAAAPSLRPAETAADLRLELPLGDVDTLALYRSMYHRRPIINGYSGYFPAHYWGLKELFAERDPAVIRALAELGSIEVVVDHALDPDEGWRRFLDSAEGVSLITRSADHSTYLAVQVPKKPHVDVGTRLPFSVLSASVNPKLGPLVQDGDLYTRWHAGREQRRGDSLTVDLASPRPISGLRMLIGGYSADFPRQLLVETSEDQQVWTQVWSGGTAVLALSGALEHPRDTPISISLEPRVARYIRLTQTASGTIYYWSVAELEILGSD